MSAMLIRDAPPRVHDWLRATANENRRSLNRQIIVCLEWCMQKMPRETAVLPTPVGLKGGPLTLDELDRARKAGRK